MADSTSVVPEYSVKRIKAKRIVNGQVQYLLRWRGFPRSASSWEPVEHLNCPDLIANFEAKHSTTATPAAENMNVNVEPRKVGFERGLEPLKILGATKDSGELMFLMLWKGSYEADLVPSKLANERCPQVVIKFYEERLAWGNRITIAD